MFLKHYPWMSSIDITWEFVRNPKSAPHTNPMEAESESEAQKSVLMSLTGDSDLLKSLKITDIKSKREIFCMEFNMPLSKISKLDSLIY